MLVWPSKIPHFSFVTADSHCGFPALKLTQLSLHCCLAFVLSSCFCFFFLNNLQLAQQLSEGCCLPVVGKQPREQFQFFKITINSWKSQLSPLTLILTACWIFESLRTLVCWLYAAVIPVILQSTRWLLKWRVSFSVSWKNQAYMWLAWYVKRMHRFPEPHVAAGDFTDLHTLYQWRRANQGNYLLHCFVGTWITWWLRSPEG